MKRKTEEKMWPYPKVLAHRGAGTLAPENTMAAMRYGWEHGFAAVEFDVMLSKDQRPVVIHDEDFGRTVAGSGKVPGHDAAFIMQQDAGAWFSADYKGEPVPDYASVVNFCRSRGIWMNVEMKPAQGYERETGLVVAAETMKLFADLSPVDKQHLPLFSSFSRAALLAAHEVAPHIPRALLVRDAGPDWKLHLQEVGACALHIRHDCLTRDLAAQVKDAGYGLFCYTVNSPERARELLSWGVDAFCTDRIDLIPADF
jgi:glycerophosphoryl diester phosphodiesterase